MIKQREALELALKAIKNPLSFGAVRLEAICEEIREALAEPEQEPVAWMCADEDMTRKGYSRFSRNCEGDWSIPVYTAPPARKPLTDEQVDTIIASNVTITDPHLLGAVYMAIREVEAAHGIGVKHE